MAVGVSVGVGVTVGVEVGVAVGVAVGVEVGVGVGVAVGVSVGVGVAVGVSVGVAVGVGVGVNSVHTDGSPEQLYPGSTAHAEEQPLPFTVSPSSHASFVPIWPSPQTMTERASRAEPGSVLGLVFAVQIGSTTVCEAVTVVYAVHTAGVPGPQ